jgi:hypothetical protein
MSISNAAAGSGDPRLSISGDEKVGFHGLAGVSVPDTGRPLGVRDPNVKFEEYVILPTRLRHAMSSFLAG